MRAYPGTRPAVLALLALCGAGGASAAGNHHAVDDAAILPRDECENESWFTRSQGGERLLQTDLQCRVGPVELSAGAEYTRPGGDAGSQTAWSLQVKWAREVADGFSLGVLVQPQWEAHQHPRHNLTLVAALATWNMTDRWALHANLGRDFVRAARGERAHDADAGNRPHSGVAAEWSPVKTWTLVGERYLEERTHCWRAGVRWAAGRNWSLDFSRAQNIAGPRPSNWTLGLTIDLDDD